MRWCISKLANRTGLTFRALISDGVECLELITYPLSNRML
jgi:hypothetical protein